MRIPSFVIRRPRAKMGNEPLLYRYNANAEHAGKYGKGAERHGGWVGRDTKQEGDAMNFFTPLCAELDVAISPRGLRVLCDAAGRHKSYYSQCKARSGLSSSRV